MEASEDEIQFLVDETFRINETRSFEIEDKDPQHGFWFQIHNGVSTYWFEFSWEPLKGYHFFPTTHLELANHIIHELSQQRFPKFEDQFFHLNDPGKSWWLKLRDERLSLYPSGRKLVHEGITEKLGHLGDWSLIQAILNKEKKALQTLLELQEIEIGPQHLSLPLNSEGARALRDLLLHGDEAFLERCHGHSTLFYLMQEILAVRKFWLAVAGTIHRSDEVPLVQ